MVIKTHSNIPLGYSQIQNQIRFPIKSLLPRKEARDREFSNLSARSVHREVLCHGQSLSEMNIFRRACARHRRYLSRNAMNSGAAIDLVSKSASCSWVVHLATEISRSFCASAANRWLMQTCRSRGSTKFVATATVGLLSISGEINCMCGHAGGLNGNAAVSDGFPRGRAGG